MIRDRGKIKWTSMMLPEHVTMLREWANEDSYEARNELDEQQVEEINQIIMEAMEYSKPVIVKQYQTNRHQYRLIAGKIHYCNDLEQKFHLVQEDETICYIPYHEIIDIQLKE